MKKRLITSGQSPFKGQDESWEQYHARKSKTALSALSSVISLVEDYLDETQLKTLEDAVDILKSISNKG